jgi:hypothetical protein
MREAGPLSRDSQHKRSLQFVNKNLQDFCSHNYRQRHSVTVDFEICVYSCLPRRSVTKEGSFVVTIF